MFLKNRACFIEKINGSEFRKKQKSTSLLPVRQQNSVSP
jgi:hypothetical protein